MSGGRPPPTWQRGLTVARTAEFEFGTSIDERANAVLHAVARALLADHRAGLLDVVAGFRVLAVEYDPRRVDL
ncbi:MAG: carboxyltransferase domain-containing protein, partial [Trueperaceae bacterium]|nr:carboxyltransferase domain-containing protein [Trueperaceae bacterium]